jgi:hypothetical protein
VRRAILVAAPVAAAAAFVGVFVFVAVQAGGDGGDADSAAGEAAQVEDAGGGADAGSAQDAESSIQPLREQGPPVVSVAGPPAEVVRILRREGISAEVVEGAVVADARAGEVDAALGGRATGPVEVYVRE